MKGYYNENDEEKAEWLREEIRTGVVADGIVDTRSIKEVEAQDLAGFAQCHFFAGIGVWSYALRLAGWPDERPVWTGSCPCPSFSAAGKGAGFDDPRHLWPDWARLIRIGKPTTIFGEQADDAIGFGWLDLVQTDLERENYAVGKAVLGACSVGAPHIRQRLYFVAHAEHAERRPFGIDREDGRHGANSGREEAHGIARTCGEVCGMGESNGTGSQPRESSATANRHGNSTLAAGAAGDVADAADSRRPAAREHGSGQSLVPARSEQHGGVSDLGDASRTGLQKRERDGRIQRFALEPQQREATERGGHVNGFWRDADWILRKRWNRDDWEWCPAQPGAFPLAHGVANRVLKLRGYGDAIVPQAAQAFIEAFMAAEEHRS